MVWLTVAYSGADRLTVAYNDDLSESITPIMYVVRGGRGCKKILIHNKEKFIDP